MEELMIQEEIINSCYILLLESLEKNDLAETKRTIRQYIEFRKQCGIAVELLNESNINYAKLMYLNIQHMYDVINRLITKNSIANHEEKKTGE
jgi:hypothetical protein